MPQQLIYTSAPQGLAAGRSGHCTVARSTAMREPLVLRLEQLSYYQHLSLSGGKERPIFAYRIVDIRGSRFHVMSRIQDAGLDFTGRTNFIAHHLVLTAEDFRHFPTPPIILRDWPGWEKSWTREPALLENEDWSALTSLGDKSSVPALTWQHVTGDFVNGYGLLEARAGATFRVDDQPNEAVLGLFAESIELLEVRDTRRDFRSAALQYTFTTSLQEQDNPADFRWRCIHSDNPAANRFATPDCRALSAVRAAKWTPEEAAFASTGRQAPRFVLEPQDVQITEGNAARFQARAEGIPNPTYQWYSVARTNTSQSLTGEISQEFVPSNPVFGISRYAVQASNSAGNIMSRTATLSIERKPALVQPKADRPQQLRREKSEQEKKNEWQEFQSQEARGNDGKGRRSWRMIGGIGLALVAILVIAITCFIWRTPTHRPTFGNWLIAKLQYLGGSTNGNPSGQITDKTGISAPSQSSPTNEPLQDTNRAPVQTGKTTSNQKQDLLADPGLSNDSKLPDVWKQMDIETTNAHIESLNGNDPNVRFKLSSVAKGFATNGDCLLFVAKTSAENSFIAAVHKIESASPLGCSGIMVRESTNATSPFLFLGASPSLDKVIVYLRSDEYQGMLYSNTVTLPKKSPDTPLFLRFDHTDNSFSPYFSVDNKQWLTSRANFTIRFKRQVHVGFAAFSASSSEKVEAIVSDVSSFTTNHMEGK
jgi:hypothetical protein